MGGSGAASKSTKVVGMARLKGSPSTVADAKEVRAILNEALNDGIKSIKQMESRVGKQMVDESIARAERVKNVINREKEARELSSFLNTSAMNFAVEIGSDKNTPQQRKKMYAMNVIQNAVQKVQKVEKKEANLSISDFERKIAKAWNGK